MGESVDLTLMLPNATDVLRFARDGPELLAKFENRRADQFLWDGLAVIEPQRQQDFEPPECFAHRWPGLGR